MEKIRLGELKMSRTFTFGKTIKTTEKEKNLLNTIISDLSKLNQNNVIEGLHIARYSVNNNYELMDRIDIYVEFNPEKEISEEIKDYMFDISEESHQKSPAIYLIAEYSGPDFPRSICIWERGDN